MPTHEKSLFDEDEPGFGRALKVVEKKVDDLVRHHHLSHWHPMATAPCNQNLELSVLDNNEVVALPFPCRRNNDGEWINADLEIRVRIEPVRWRVWQKNNMVHCSKSIS